MSDEIWDGRQFDAFSSTLLHLAADQEWPRLVIAGRELISGGQASWMEFLALAARAERELAMRVLQVRRRLNGHRAVPLWR
jgi:hypothetical protein